MSRVYCRLIYLLYILCCVLIVSCKTSKKLLTGGWVIESSLNKENNQRLYFSINYISLYNNYDCELPKVYMDVNDEYRGIYYAIWESEKSTDSTGVLTIRSKNNFLSGKYYYKVYKDTIRSTVVLELESYRLYMKCFKDMIGIPKHPLQPGMYPKKEDFE